MNSSKMLSVILLGIAVVVSLVLFRQQNQRKVPSTPIGQRIEIKAPLGLPPVPVPEDNPPTVETVALGRRLYYDPRLSVDGSISCATCHSPEAGFADPKAVSVGVDKKTGTRNSPTVFNSAYFRRRPVTRWWLMCEIQSASSLNGSAINFILSCHTCPRTSPYSLRGL